MRNSGLRLVNDFEFIESSIFLKVCKFISENHFTRKRKLFLNNLVLSIVNRKGLSLAMEIRKFFSFLIPKNPETISTAGYLKQRLKLNPAAFLRLSDFHVSSFYADEKDLVKNKGYFVFAVDGSHMNLPNTDENISSYGAQLNHTDRRQAQAGISCLYDVHNKMVLDCTINGYKFNEREQVEKHIEKIPSFIGSQTYILLLDRGYPSSIFLINRLERNQKFVVRLSSTDYKQEQQSMKSNDEDVEIVFTKARINPYRNTEIAKRLREKGSITLRFVRLQLPGGEIEYLATNLSRREFSEQDVGQLYGLRWGIETAYDVLKNKFMVENFTGKKSIIIEQDILSTIYIYNITHDILRDAEIERQDKDTGKIYKHKMVLNVNIAIGIIKEDLIHMALQKDPDERRRIFEKIIYDISNCIVPVRKDRQFDHIRKFPAIKYSFSKKKSY